MFIGNDIVDTKTAEAIGKSGDHRFVGRVLTPNEQKRMAASDNPDALLWTFWAAKEAAYKAISKAVPDISSAPRRYPVFLDALYIGQGFVSGRVETPRGTASIRCVSHDDYIHCLASTDGAWNFSDVVHGLENAFPDRAPGSARESAVARSIAGARIASVLSRSPEDVQILRKNGFSGEGPPMVYVAGEKVPVDISLSHDGRFVAYAFWLPPS